METFGRLRPNTYPFLTRYRPTNERPDIIIWSVTAKHVMLFELTCGAEEGIPAAVIRKKKRYKELIEAIIAASWRCSFRTMEVGARGFVAHSTRRCLTSIGFSCANAKRVCKQLSLVSARCSYAIWLSHKKSILGSETCLDLSPHHSHHIETQTTIIQTVCYCTIVLHFIINHYININSSNNNTYKDIHHNINHHHTP